MQKHIKTPLEIKKYSHRTDFVWIADADGKPVATGLTAIRANTIVQEINDCDANAALAVPGHVPETVDIADPVKHSRPSNMDAARWLAIETLMMAGRQVELEQHEDGGWAISMEGVECADQRWTGDTPAHVADKIVAQLSLRTEASVSENETKPDSHLAELLQTLTESLADARVADALGITRYKLLDELHTKVSQLNG